MSLRRQLILLSLLALVLPWAGLQFFGQINQLQRDNQMQALALGTQAVARMIGASGELLAAMTEQLPKPGQSPLYAHPVSAAPVVDGYDDEWRYYPFPSTPLGDGGANVQIAETGDDWFVFVRVATQRVDYHNPGRHPAASGDHLRLLGRSSSGLVKHYWVSASAPGKAQVYWRRNAQQFTPEHRFTAYWQERAGGYQLELRLPKSLFGHSLLVQVADAKGVVAASQVGEAVPPLMSQQDLLSRQLAVFSSDQLRLMLVSVDGWLLAQSGRALPVVEDPDYGTPQNAGAYTWLLQRLLPQVQLIPWQDAARLGRLVPPTQADHWFQADDAVLGQHWQPVYAGDQLAGYLVAEQRAETEGNATTAALWKLLGYSLLAMAAIALALLGFASWLSFRVRRLSRAVRAAVDDQGQLAIRLPEQARVDELGDLSRDIGGLLTRIKEYNDYLKSLASKLSHELRTPLAVVKSSLENLAQESDPEQLSVYQQRALAGSERLSAILNAMSAASRLEAALPQAEMETLILNDFLQELAGAYSDSFNRPIHVRLPEAAVSAQVAPDLLVQLFDKLVENACDFCPPDGEITLLLRVTDSGLALGVSNDGPLLPAHMQHQLFDSLVSVRAGNEHSSHLGLGLYLVRLIAHYHGGSAHAANRADGSGVEMTVLLHR